MNVKQTLKSKYYQIPIEKYEKEMNTKLSKDKKEEILDLFINYNNLLSEEEFSGIESGLHDACKRGDLELIKIYLSETIENSSKDLQFKIDRQAKTASLFTIKSYNSNEFIIPRTFHHESVDYLITSVNDLSQFDSITIKFEENSGIKTIYRNASEFSDLFSTSAIEEIYFPESLKELKEGWCYRADKLKKIIISPNNDRFIYKDDKYLLGKSDPNNDEFDTFLFVRRDIKEISIPSNIKIISSYAFSECNNLKKVEISPNSNLQIIESNAFSYSNIGEIYFPTCLKELKEGWCSDIEKLTKIIISPNNDKFIFKDDKYLLGKSDPNIDEFDTLLFVRRDINEISIPSNIKIISSCAFQWCKDLTKVEISPNSNLQIIESNSFSYSKIKDIFIPSKVYKICDYAFHNCDNLKKVEISANSNLQIIESNAFSYSSIEEINFPESLKELKEGWCYRADKLTKIIISPMNGRFIYKEDKYLLGKSDPNNDEFDILLFVRRDIKEISIPSDIKIISSFVFHMIENLTKVETSPNSNLQIIESHAFSGSKIKEFFIPSKVTKICERAFSSCQDLTKVEISINSNLKIIERNAFSYSKIKDIFIPSKVTKICERAFSCCQNLTKVEISPNSNLQIIERNAFSYSKIKEFFIPSKVSEIYEYSFSNCENLQIIEISEESELKSIPLSAFNKCVKIIFMIPSSLKIHFN